MQLTLYPDQIHPLNIAKIPQSQQMNHYQIVTSPSKESKLSLPIFVSRIQLFSVMVRHIAGNRIEQKQNKIRWKEQKRREQNKEMGYMKSIGTVCYRKVTNEKQKGIVTQGLELDRSSLQLAVRTGVKSNLYSGKETYREKEK